MNNPSDGNSKRRDIATRGYCPTQSPDRPFDPQNLPKPPNQGSAIKKPNSASRTGNANND